MVPNLRSGPSPGPSHLTGATVLPAVGVILLRQVVRGDPERGHLRHPLEQVKRLEDQQVAEVDQLRIAFSGIFVHRTPTANGTSPRSAPPERFAAGQIVRSGPIGCGDPQDQVMGCARLQAGILREAALTELGGLLIEEARDVLAQGTD